MKRSAIDDVNPASEGWGPVRRGFAVRLPDGRRGSLADIRHTDGGGVELLVATGLFSRTLVTVRAADIEAIMPRGRRIIVGDAADGCHDAHADGTIGTAGGIARLPIANPSRSDPPKDAA